jgi:heptosyltransferase-1
MGDLVHTLPALVDASKYYPGIRFDWVSEQAFAEIPSWHPAVGKVIPIHLRSWKRQPFCRRTRQEISRSLGQLRGIHYDQVIDAQGLVKSAIVTRLTSGIRNGMTWSSCREGLASLAYQRKFEITKGRHAIERVRDLFAAVLGYHYDSACLDYGLVRETFTGPCRQPAYLVFLHGTSAEKKLWQDTEWIGLADKAERHGYRVLLPWGNYSEQTRAQRIASASGNVQVLPAMNLKDMAGVLAAASGVVGLDSGLSHLAAALGLPAVTLYTATSAGLTGACGSNQVCLSRIDLPNQGEPAARHMLLKRLQTLDAGSVWGVLEEQMAGVGRYNC